MRWPLRHQILVPMAIILLVALAVVSAANAWLASNQVIRQLERQLAAVSQTLTASNFPLESRVLQQIHGLTGAEFVVLDAAGHASASSDDKLVPQAENGTPPPRQFQPSSVVAVGGSRYFHAAFPLDRRPHGGQLLHLHVFYSEDAWQTARWQAIVPPLGIGAVSLLLVIIVVALLIRRITKPLRALQTQVSRIAHGDFRTIALPHRDDEVQGLAIAVNHMALRLTQYEDQIRKNERLKTLGTLGGGIAHQIRNAATGCRIALDLHQRDCRLATANASGQTPLHVATQQLVQIESYVQRFLALGKPSTVEHAPTELADVIRAAEELIRPVASHNGIRLTVSLPERPALVLADAAALTQMLVNLLMNAIQAAAPAGGSNGFARNSDRLIEILVHSTDSDDLELAVVDSGPGPAPAIEQRLFEPFATDKPGGTGLGLAVCRQIATDHGGSIRWERRDSKTWFVVLLPAESHQPAVP